MDQDGAIAFLNGMLELDAAAVTRLVGARVECNEALANHPSIQAGPRDGGGFEIGFLGVLNGLFGTIPEGPRKGWGYIMAHFEEGQIVRFARTEDWDGGTS